MSDDAIEQALHRLWARAVLNGSVTSRTKDYEIEEAAQQIRQHVLDVIGEDEPVESQLKEATIRKLDNELSELTWHNHFVRNKLREEQRRKLDG